MLDALGVAFQPLAFLHFLTQRGGAFLDAVFEGGVELADRLLGVLAFMYLCLQLSECRRERRRALADPLF